MAWFIVVFQSRVSSHETTCSRPFAKLVGQYQKVDHGNNRFERIGPKWRRIHVATGGLGKPVAGNQVPDVYRKSHAQLWRYRWPVSRQRPGVQVFGFVRAKSLLNRTAESSKSLAFGCGADPLYGLLFARTSGGLPGQSSYKRSAAGCHPFQRIGNKPLIHAEVINPGGAGHQHDVTGMSARRDTAPVVFVNCVALILG